MTIVELREKLCSMPKEEFLLFVEDYGGDFGTPEDVVRSYVDNPGHERRLCHLLTMTTQEERITEASVSSAYSARLSTICVLISVVISVIAIAISLFL